MKKLDTKEINGSNIAIAETGNLETQDGKLIVLSGEDKIYDTNALPSDTVERLRDEGWRIA